MTDHPRHDADGVDVFVPPAAVPRPPPPGDTNDTPTRRPPLDGTGLQLPSPWLMPRHLVRASSHPSPSSPPYGLRPVGPKFNDVSPDEPMMFASATASSCPGSGIGGVRIPKPGGASVDHPLAMAPMRLEPTFAPFLARAPLAHARTVSTSGAGAQPPTSPVKKQRTRGDDYFHDQGDGGVRPPWTVPRIVPGDSDGDSDEENSPLSSPQVLASLVATTPLRSRTSTGSSTGQCTPSKRSHPSNDEDNDDNDDEIASQSDGLSPFTPSGQLLIQNLRIHGPGPASGPDFFPSLSSATPGSSLASSASSSRARAAALSVLGGGTGRQAPLPSLPACPSPPRLPKDCIAGGGRAPGCCLETPDRARSVATTTASSTPSAGVHGSPFHSARRTPIGQQRGSVFQTLPPRSVAGASGMSPVLYGGLYGRTNDDDSIISGASGRSARAFAPPPLISSVGSFGSAGGPTQPPIQSSVAGASPKVVRLTVLDPSEGSPYAPRRTLGPHLHTPQRPGAIFAEGSPASSSRAGRHVRSGSGFSAGSLSLVEIETSVINPRFSNGGATASPLMKSLDSVRRDGDDSDGSSDDDDSLGGLGPWTSPRLECPSIQVSFHIFKVAGSGDLIGRLRTFGRRTF